MTENMDWLDWRARALSAESLLAATDRRAQAAEASLRTMEHFAEVAETCERKANESHARREAAEAREAKLRMQYEASQGALSDLLTEHRQDAEAVQRALSRAEAIEPNGSPEWVESGLSMKRTVLHTIRAVLAEPTTGGTEPDAEDGATFGLISRLTCECCCQGCDCGCVEDCPAPACRKVRPAPVADPGTSGA